VLSSILLLKLALSLGRQTSAALITTCEIFDPFLECAQSILPLIACLFLHMHNQQCMSELSKCFKTALSHNGSFDVQAFTCLSTGN